MRPLVFSTKALYGLAIKKRKVRVFTVASHTITVALLALGVGIEASEPSDAVRKLDSGSRPNIAAIQ